MNREKGQIISVPGKIIILFQAFEFLERQTPVFHTVLIPRHIQEPNINAFGIICVNVPVH